MVRYVLFFVRLEASKNGVLTTYGWRPRYALRATRAVCFATRFYKEAYKNGFNLVAGAGFEPATFGL
jgi:hypothetical protein